MLDAAFPILADTPLIQLLPHRCLAGISAFQGKTAALEQALGVSLPAAPRRIAFGGTEYLWSGPGSWLAMSGDPSLLSTISAAAAGLAAVTDQSDGRSLFRVTGPHAAAILARLVPMDLHPSVFPPDATALTLAAHIGVQLWREDDGAFVLACFRSYAGALHHALTGAAREFEGRG